MPSHRILLAVAVSCARAGAEGSESRSVPAHDNRASVYMQAGFSTASPHMSGAALGATVLRDLGSRLALEVAGAYLDRGSGASGASLSTSMLLHLASREEEAVPYLSVGAGLYRASFDTRDPRLAGPRPSGEMGTGRYRHVMPAGPPGWDLGQAPEFYGDRLANLIARQGRLSSTSFSDPAVVAGAGMRVRLGHRWSLRQDARVQVVVRAGATYAMGLFTFQVGYGSRE